MKKRLLLIGGGGHCKSVIDSVVSSEIYDEIGIVDNIYVQSYQGIGVVGSDNELPELYQQGWRNAFITVGSVGNTEIRRKLYVLVRSIGFTVPVIVDRSASIARETSFGVGTFIGKNVVVNSCVETGICSIINSGAIVEHDCAIGDFTHISPGAILCGQVKVGKDSHIGAGAVIRQLISVGDNTLVGAGSVVVKDIQSGATAYGNPCRVIDK